MDGRDATTQAIKDLEDAMNEVRMAGIQAKSACLGDQSKLKNARCPVPTKTLALAGQARILAAAQQPSPASILEDMYGPLFPFTALDASDAAVQRVEAAEVERQSNAPRVNQGGDPLAVAHVLLPEQGSASANGEPQRSGSVSSAISGIGRRIMRRGSAAHEEEAVEDEPRGLGGLGRSSRPSRAPRQPAPAAAADIVEADPDDALAAPPPPPPAPAAGADPLADPLGGGGLGPGSGFGVDPLAGPRVAARPPTPQNGQHEAQEDEGEEEEPRAAPQRAAPAAAQRRAPPRPAPRPRPAPPAPGAPRAAPPAPGIGGRPAPLRSAPGRPAPVGRAAPPPPPRAAPGRDLPL